jgi:hypothetical protein
MLLKRAYTKQEFARFIAERGFQSCQIKETPMGFEITLSD